MLGATEEKLFTTLHTCIFNRRTESNKTHLRQCVKTEPLHSKKANATLQYNCLSSQHHHCYICIQLFIVVPQPLCHSFHKMAQCGDCNFGDLFKEMYNCGPSVRSLSLSLASNLRQQDSSTNKVGLGNRLDLWDEFPSPPLFLFLEIPQ